MPEGSEEISPVFLPNFPKKIEVENS